MVIDPTDQVCEGEAFSRGAAWSLLDISMLSAESWAVLQRLASRCCVPVLTCLIDTYVPGSAQHVS